MSPKATNITWHAGSVSAETRERLLNQRGCVVWLTGLPGSGKSTIGRALERRLAASGHAAYVLDGDNVRHGLNSDLGFSPTDRDENIRRVGHVAAMLADAGLIAITAFVSPYRAGRARARKLVPRGRFIEVFCGAPLSVCQHRDPKGLYRKARQGKLTDFTGVSAPYETPREAELVLDTAAMNVSRCVRAIENALRRRRLLSPTRRRAGKKSARAEPSAAGTSAQGRPRRA